MSAAYPPPPSQPGQDQGPQFGEVHSGGGQAVSQARYVEADLVKPLVTYVIMGLTILVFIAQLASEYLLGGDLPAAIGVKSNDAILEGQFWRLFTPMLLHGSILHVGFNMYALNAFGPTLERYYGHARFLALYVLAGFAGNVVSFLFTPANSLGSSTAIFGLLGAFGVFMYQNQQLFGGRARRGLVNIVTIALINLAIGLSPGIDNWGHIGGLLGGGLFAWLGGPVLKVELAYPSMRLEDRRQVGDVLRAGLVVGMVFSGLLAAALLRRWF